MLKLAWLVYRCPMTVLVMVAMLRAWALFSSEKDVIKVLGNPANQTSAIVCMIRYIVFTCGMSQPRRALPTASRSSLS